MLKSRRSSFVRSVAGAMVLTGLTGCASVAPDWLRRAEPAAAEPAAADREDEGRRVAREREEERARARTAVPASPLDVAPDAGRSEAVWSRAVNARGTRIVVSIRERALWLLDDSTTLMRAPVAVGMNDGFTYEGTRYHFETPVSVRKVLEKGVAPLWVPPDWHYLEKVVERGLEPVRLRAGRKEMLGDGTWIEIRGEQVGRVNQFGNFAPFTPGTEIIFDGKIYIPPFGTAQRRIPGILGSHKLAIGDGYLIHGTPEEDSIGDAVSHGCVRMYDEDVARLYDLAPVGTPVFLY